MKRNFLYVIAVIAAVSMQSVTAVQDTSLAGLNERFNGYYTAQEAVPAARGIPAVSSKRAVRADQGIPAVPSSRRRASTTQGIPAIQVNEESEVRSQVDPLEEAMMRTQDRLPLQRIQRGR